MRWPLLLALLAGCLPTPPPGDAAADRASTERASRPPNERPDLSDLDRRVAHAANLAREGEGLGAYRWSDDLAAVARHHSADMARRDFFDHVNPDGQTPSDRALVDGIECRVPLGGGRLRVGVSENLYEISAYEKIRIQTYGGREHRTTDWYSPAELAGIVTEGWLDSPGHRRNLLDAVSTAQGVGVEVAGDRVFVTQMMC